MTASLWSAKSEAAALNDYILDYQPLHFDHEYLHEKHRRMKRALDPHLQWSFAAYGRTFNLRLQPAKSIFADNHELVMDNQPPTPVDTSFIYEGSLTGDPASSAFISIIKGSVSGHVIVPGNTTYHIEPARNHFQNSQFHTIIYPESHMDLDPYRHRRVTGEACGSRELYDKLNKRWRLLKPLEVKVKPKDHWGNDFHNKYSAEVNTQQTLSRKKRDYSGKSRTCVMMLQADTILYKHFVSKYGSATATDELINLFASHINEINTIYGKTEFVRRDKPEVRFTGTQFQLQRSQIFSNCTKPGFCNDNLDVSNFLDLTAEDNFDKFCLVHTFTYRDFVGGTLGLAWVASPDSPNAGICGLYRDMRDSNNGISKRSLNTGIVTLINFKNDVPARVSQLTFAHEVGHNFGAQHDTTSECAPYGTNQAGASDGNYIMFPSATQGNLNNNRKFSSCSKDSIARVLETLGQTGGRPNCFTESDKPFCGNKIVEPAGYETCDCGIGSECTDLCCVGSKKGENQTCKLRPQTNCSPSQGMCCTTNCSFAETSIKCQAATECAEDSHCTNSNATCPQPMWKQDNTTFCSNSTKVCTSGQCTGSVCLNIGWEECFLTSAEATSVEQMCYVSCKKNDTSECISSFDEAKVNANVEFKKLLAQIKENRGNSDTSTGVERPAGSPCNNFKGYCDVFSKCRNVDAEGPFKQLTDLIFNPVTLKIIRSWIEDHWWAVLLMCVGVVVFMGIFVKVFEYNTPSKDPKKKVLQPPVNRQQAVPARPNQDTRQGVYSTDVPMQDRGNYGGHGAYDNQGYQGQAPGHQQYDRVSRARHY